MYCGDGMEVGLSASNRTKDDHRESSRLDRLFKFERREETRQKSAASSAADADKLNLRRNLPTSISEPSKGMNRLVDPDLQMEPSPDLVQWLEKAGCCGWRVSPDLPRAPVA